MKKKYILKYYIFNTKSVIIQEGIDYLIIELIATFTASMRENVLIMKIITFPHVYHLCKHTGKL